MLICVRLREHGERRQGQRLKWLDIPSQVPLFFREVPDAIPVRGRWFLSESRDALNIEGRWGVVGSDLETVSELPLSRVPFPRPIGRKALAELITQLHLSWPKRSCRAEELVNTRGFAFADDRNQVELTAFDFFLGDAQCILRYDNFRAIDLVHGF